MSRSDVAVMGGRNLFDATLNALDSIEGDIGGVIKKGKSVLLKPNMVSARNQLSASERESLHAVLEYLTRVNPGEVVVGEGASVGDTFEGFRDYGYLSLKDDYDVEFIDLNDDVDDYVEVDMTGCNRVFA